MAKHRAKKGGQARWYVPLDALRFVAERVVEFDAKGQEFDVGSIWRDGDGLNWNHVLCGLGIFWVAGLLSHTRGVMPAYYRLKAPMTAEDIMGQVLECVEPDA